MNGKMRSAAFAAALLVFGSAAASAASGPKALIGHVAPQIRSAARLARVAADENVELSLVVGIDQALLDRTLAELYGPNAAPDRHFLTSAEFAQKFDLANKRRALKDFAAASGLAAAADDSPGSLVVKVSGAARRVENAFGVQLNRYRAADGQVFRGHDADPVIPGSVAPHLRAVLGLSNYRGAMKPHLRGARRVPDGIGTAGLSSGPNPSILLGNGPGNGLNPSDIKSIYGLSGALTGTGQTVALFELDGYNPADITAYESDARIFSSSPHTPVTFVGVDGVSNLCGPSLSLPCNATTNSTDGGMLEVALDIDMMIALAPGVSQILVYTAPNTNQGNLDCFAKIASDNTAKSVSTSWGLNEQDSGGAFMASENTIFQQLAAQGQTIFAAAGDSGAYDASGLKDANNALVGWAGALLTDDPASQPYVTAVGGTALTGTIASHSEAVWNEGCSSANNPGTNCSAKGAGGGGIADYGGTYWPLPNWQSGVAGSASQQFRNVPDVALNADPVTSPYVAYVAGGFYYVGGTSAAAPLWAAVMALTNQKRASNGYGTLGFANPALYQLGSGSSHGSYFNDIVSGDNGFYGAGNGYDNASGWGSFKGDALIGVLSTPLAPASAVTGLTSFTLGVSSIQYTWNALSNATGYDVYYATNSSQILALAVQPPYVQTGLIGNTLSGILVRGENQGIEGPGAFVSAATFAQAPSETPTAAGFSSSATFTYSACPAAPSPFSCSGYAVQASTAADFSGTVFSTSSLSPVAVPLALTGLASNTGYYMRLAHLSPVATPAYGPIATFNTGTSLVAPTAPVFDQISTGTIRFSWSKASNPNGIQYLVQAATAANFSGTVQAQSGTALLASFAGLAPDTSYYFRVQGLGGPFLTAGPQATLAASPLAAASSFPSVGVNGFTLAWAAGGNQPDTLYQAQISPAADFSSAVISTQVRTTAALFSGLVGNTRYYAQVEAIGRTGITPGYVALGSTTTLVLAPTLPPQPFSALTANGFTFAFTQTDAPGTRYFVAVATDPGFATIVASSNTASASAAFTGLLSNQAYSVEVAALNLAGSPSLYAVSAPTATTVAAALAAAVPVATVTAASFGFRWDPGTLAPGTPFLAQVSSSPAFAAGVLSSTTANAFAAFSGLPANTTFYGRVQPLSLSANPNGPVLSPAVVSATLPNLPAAGVSPFLMVGYTSATVAWTPLPLSPPVSAAEGYLVQFSSAADFATVAAYAATGPSASSATVTGLAYATPYFARVGSVGWEGLANFLPLGSTTTALPPLSSGTVAPFGLALGVGQASPQVLSMNVLVPAGAFPSGTPVSAVANVVPLPPAVTNEASSITPFGVDVGLVLTANGLQPASPVTITMAYDFTKIPPGQNESRLQLWRYDPPTLQWTLVPSHDDPVGHVLTARTAHFSTFAPFFVAPGSDVSSVQAWPQPWEIGDSSSRYWADVLTFSGLPPAATVKIFTISGELVWSGVAAGSGVLTWDGHNRFGRKAASGTYYAAFQNGGQTKTRRLVIIR